MLLRRIVLSLLFGLGIVVGLTGCDLGRGMGELIDEQEFEALSGYDHGWFANLQPSKKYRITVQATEITNTEIMATLSVKKGLSCEDCDLSVFGYLNQDKLVVTFISPPDGRINIVLYITGADILCTVKISRIDP
jgi:hypothetical protein